MIKFSVDDYRRIAERVKEFQDTLKPIDFSVYDNRVYDYDEGAVVAKERPRAGKSGKFYTPTETRKFEAAIKKWGMAQDMQPVAYPMSVRIVVRDQTDDPLIRVLGAANVSYAAHKDLDNLAKSVLDGLNGVLYKDDKQIVDLHVSRRYGKRPGFLLSVHRQGLSATEVTNLKKFL